MSAKQVVLITGASKGLGLECARILLGRFDANVVALSRSLTPELEELKSGNASQLEVVQGDVCNVADQTVRVNGWLTACATNACATQKAVEAAVSKFGKLDGLILNACVVERPYRHVQAETFRTDLASQRCPGASVAGRQRRHR